MNPCHCGCGKLVKGRWARGHQWRKGRGNMPITGDPPIVASAPQGLDGPPPYPHALDRRRWRLASERPGTNPWQPWIETRCAQCHQKMWTRDLTSTWEHGGVCEECTYILRSEMWERQGQQFNTQVRTLHDPFRPK